MKSLAARTVLGFTQLIVFLGAALFVPAWTLNFWQAWIYLFIFVAASALITTYLWMYDRKLLENRVKAGPRAEKERSQKRIQLLASMDGTSCEHEDALRDLLNVVAIAGLNLSRGRKESSQV